MYVKGKEDGIREVDRYLRQKIVRKNENGFYCRFSGTKSNAEKPLIIELGNVHEVPGGFILFYRVQLKVHSHLTQSLVQMCLNSPLNLFSHLFL